ncbi:MAG TPA: 4-(cytidine 5'-diphospho)-2-C-methyl-D-erythritol kinase [Gemmatimonadales bacterium]|nr:4-(cytidine 5'-diphospho)-2-C-methyl-D-erythritol kinase [Gemmatimonadales bacterium]
MTETVTLPCPAKVNLFLRVLAREDDGYHGIETLFCRISLADELVMERREGRGVTIEVEGADTGPDEQNLAVRAAQMVLAATGNRCAVHIRLTKRVPVQAGLGGGSSNAAAALTAAGQLTGNAIPRHELLQFASRLGADVPFFLSGASLALAWGHGERLMRLPPLPTAPALVVVPPNGIGTADAYRWVDEAREGAGRRGSVVLDGEVVGTWGDVARMGGNDFESPVFGRHPEIRGAFEALAVTHPLLCRMTGSGSALFAVYRSAGQREDAKMMLGRKWGKVLEVETG